MKKRYIFAIIIGFMLLFTTTTNPSSKYDYVNWVKEQISEENGILLGWLGGTVVNSETTKKNMVLFTLYETKIGKEDNEKLVAIGILNNFIWIKGFPEDSPK
ncbi:DUF4359 domain-containing protein [Bacillus nitroreducens]